MACIRKNNNVNNVSIKNSVSFSCFPYICHYLSSHKETMNKFGDLIKAKREEQEMLQRHLAAQLDIDTAQLSKMERGERTARKEHVTMLIEILKLDKENALSLWLADQVYTLVADEEQALNALKVAEQEVKYLRKK